MKLQTSEQAAVNAEKRTDRRKAQGPKNVRFFTGELACVRGDVTWRVSGLNESRKIVQCPNCGTDNDIQEAKKRAA